MKNSVLFTIFFPVILISLNLQSCSNENLVTTPPNDKDNIKSMPKTVVIPTSSISHSTDTVITLPKSHMTLVLSKNYSARQIAQIDSFLTTHTLRTKTSTMSPMLQNCADRTFYNWEMEDQYQPATGKYIGIWTHAASPQQLHDQWGFTYYFAINGLSSGNDSSVTNYFPPLNIMCSIPYYITSTRESIANEISPYPLYGFYYLDEPYEHMNFTLWQIITGGLFQAKPNANLYISDYYYPISSPVCPSGNGYDMESWLWGSTMRIMCDKYTTTLCGNAHDYWNEYKAFYQIPDYNSSNWISLNYQDEWGDLLNLASAWGLNPIWIYGDDSNINSGTIDTFASTAWETGWLLREEKQVFTEWKCVQNNCTSCSYPTQGTWYLYDMYYTGTVQYVQYQN